MRAISHFSAFSEIHIFSFAPFRISVIFQSLRTQIRKNVDRFTVKRRVQFSKNCQEFARLRRGTQHIPEAGVQERLRLLRGLRVELLLHLVCASAGEACAARSLSLSLSLSLSSSPKCKKSTQAKNHPETPGEKVETARKAAPPKRRNWSENANETNMDGANA